LAATATFTHEDKVANAAMLGVLPFEADKISKISESMVQGDLNSIIGGKRILLGRSLAEKLDMKLGDTVHADFPDARDLNLTVSGIFDTGYASVDEKTSYVSLETAQVFLNEGNVVTQIDIKLNDIDQAQAVAGQISSDRYEVQVWQESNPEIVE